MDFNPNLLNRFFQGKYSRKDYFEIKEIFSDVQKRSALKKQLGASSSIEDHSPDLSFVMIREDIWNHIMFNFEGSFYDYESKEYNTITAMEYCKRTFDKEIKKAVELRNSDNKFDHELICRLFSREYGGENLLSNYMSYNLFFSESIDNKEILDDIFKQWSEYRIIYFSLNQ
jgi:hypothetical protein